MTYSDAINTSLLDYADYGGSSFMKKPISFALILTLVALLFGCGPINNQSSSQDVPDNRPLELDTPDNKPMELLAATPPVTMLTEATYSSDFIALSYIGVLRILFEGGAANYEVWDDRAFVDDVWNNLNYDAWLELDGNIEDISHNQDVIWLRFYLNPNDRFDLSIGSDDIACGDDYAWSVGSTYYDVRYHVMPQGTFERISRLLTEYSVENSESVADIETVRDFSLGSGYVSFALTDAPVNYVRILKEDAGDFVAQWELESWQPYDYSQVSESTSIIHGPAFTGNVGIDRVNISINTFDGVYVLSIGKESSSSLATHYSIPESVYQTIEKQFEGFKEIYLQY